MSITDRGLRIAGLSLVVASGVAPALAAQPCAALRQFQIPGHAVRIDSAQDVPAGTLPPAPNAPPGTPATAVPAHCRVDGVIDDRQGVDGKPYGIGFAIALPADWNGRLLFQGGGGLNGAVNPPLGAQYAGEKSALAQGFAVASTDSGHKGTGFDATFFQDQLATLNFLYQGVAQTTVVAKAIVNAHYGKPQDHAYFVGCSTGGREAMMMSQRFPLYFDGIVAGAPAMRTNFSNLALRSATTALNVIAPRDASGKPQTNAALSAADRKLVVDGALAACDALDGRKDGLIFAPQSCRFDPGTLACTGAKTERCLTSEQANAVRIAMNGPKTTSGRQVYPGFYYDTGIGASGRGLPGLLAGPVIPEGAPAGTTFDVDAAAAEAMDARAMAGDSQAWTNLSSFQGHGGKLIFFHGVSDPWFSSQDTVQYYERLERAMTAIPLDSWSRLFLVPGMGHCSGGERTLDRFDMLSAIVAWVENGRAPERVVATGTSMAGESRPLCPFPQHAQFGGQGDPQAAASYACATPR